MTNNTYNPFADNLRTIIVNGVSEWLDSHGHDIPDPFVFEGWLDTFIDIYSDLGLPSAIMSFEISSSLFRAIFSAYTDKVKNDDMADSDWDIANGSATNAIAVGLILRVAKELQV